jgi:hypothetical protein
MFEHALRAKVGAPANTELGRSSNPCFCTRFSPHRSRKLDGVAAPILLRSGRFPGVVPELP